MGFIVREFHFAFLIFSRKFWVLIVPLLFLIFALMLKLILIQKTEVDTSTANLNFIRPIIEAVKERSLEKMNKIAFWGTLSLFVACYLKARKQIFRWF
jgi:hypothetical protein